MNRRSFKIKTPSNTWHHCASVFSATADRRVFMDRELKDTDTLVSIAELYLEMPSLRPFWDLDDPTS
jgi:hypothetical protein